MAEKLGGSAYNIPGNGKVINSDWRDDVPKDDDFELYDKEKEYISPDSVKKETAAEIKSFQEKVTLKTALSSYENFRKKELSRVA